MSESLKEITGLTLRMGSEGPEMQVIYDARGGSSIFYKLEPEHIEYMFINLQFFMKQAQAKTSETSRGNGLSGSGYLDPRSDPRLERLI